MKYVVTAFLLHKDTLFLIKHRRLQRWLPVGGHVNKDETFDQALLREIKEETNLSPEIISYQSLNFTSSSALKNPFFMFSDGDETVLEYVGRIDDIADLKLQKEEIVDARCFSRDEIKTKECFAHLREKALFAFDIATNNLTK